MAEFSDLSGVWQGKYSYAAAMRPNSFAAHLDDDDGALRGEIIEPNTITAGGPDELIAALAGSRLKRDVEFTKSYSDVDQPALRYEGQLNAALTRIDGTWHFPSEPWVHGTFMMVRETGRGLRAARQRAVERA